MAEFPNFGYMSTFTIWFTSRDKILLVESFREIKTSQFLYQNFFILKRPTVANFVDIVKTPTMFIKNTFKDSKTVKRIRNYEFKCNLYLYFLVYQNLLISMRKHWCQPNSIGVSNDLYFLDLLRVSYNCAKCHHCTMKYIMKFVWNILGRGSFWSPQTVRTPEKKNHYQ